MLENIGDILQRNAPDLYARTKLPRKSEQYLTQRLAFDIYRQRRLDDLKQHAPDLYTRMTLPIDDEDYLPSHRAHQLYDLRKKATK